MEFRRDNDGIREILKSAEMAAAVQAKANEVAANVRGQNLKTRAGKQLPVKVDTYTTDRAAASVTITHPAGIGMQAKHGALTKAAAAAGLEVTD